MSANGVKFNGDPGEGVPPSFRPASTTPPPLNIRLRRYLVQLVILGLAVHFLLPQLTTFAHSAEVLKNMKWGIIALACLSQILSYAGSGYLIKATAGLAGQSLSTGTGAAVALGSGSIGLVAGGTFGVITTSYHWLRERGVSVYGAWMASWLPNLFFNNALMFLLSVFGLFHLLMVHELSAMEAAGFGFAAAFLGLVAGVLFWGAGHRPAISRGAIVMGRIWSRVRRRRFEEESVSRLLDPLWSAWDIFRQGGWLRPTIGSALNVGFDMLTLFLIFVSAGEMVSPGVLLVGYGLPQLLAKITILPGGVGVVEGAMAALYHSLGVTEAVSVVVIIAYRVLSFWLPTIIGFPIASYLERKPISMRP